MIHALWLLAVLILTEDSAGAVQKNTISVASEEVRIDVLVTEKGKPVAGLKSEDFEILDNGVPQEINYIALQKQTPINAIFVLDISSSVSGELLTHLRSAASGFLNSLAPDDQAALILFNHRIALGAPLARNIAEIQSALAQAQPFGNSSLIDASYAGLALAQSRPEPALVLVFSDGRDTFSWLTEESVLETAKRNGTVVYAVSIGRLPSRNFLQELTRTTGGALIEPESTKDLAAVFLGILNEFRQRYLVTYTPQGITKSGWHALELRMKNRAYKATTRPGYMRRSADP